LVHDEKWNAEINSIAELERLLQQESQAGIPSPDTLARLVDDLFKETGKPGLHRRPRRSRRRA
jgi:hypothetical protein